MQAQTAPSKPKGVREILDFEFRSSVPHSNYMNYLHASIPPFLYHTVKYNPYQYQIVVFVHAFLQKHFLLFIVSYYYLVFVLWFERRRSGMIS